MSDAAVPLPATLAECHAKLLEQQATIDEQQAVLQAMQRDLAAMRRMLFGQRRERFEDPRQGTLFDSVVLEEVGELQQDESANEEAALPGTDSLNEDEATTASRRNGRGRRVFPKCLPREERVCKLSDEAIPEALRGTDFRRFRKKVSEWIEYLPPSMKVIDWKIFSSAVGW